MGEPVQRREPARRRSPERPPPRVTAPPPSPPDEQHNEPEPAYRPAPGRRPESPGDKRGTGAADANAYEAPWLGERAPAFDKHMEARMELNCTGELRRHPGCYNVGHNYARLRAGPLCPRDGFYDERYVCATLKADEIDEEADFAMLLGDDEAGVTPPSRVTLAMKGITDLHCEWLALFLDETSLPYGERIKAWREAEGGPFGCKKLWLNDNPITEAGVICIADALKNNHTLEELYLHYTPTGDVGLRHLLEMLNQNTALKRLELGACGITEAGAEAIIKALKPGGSASRNKTVLHIGLHGNDDSLDDNLPEIYDLLEEEARSKRG